SMHARLTSFFLFRRPAPTALYTLSLHDALPILSAPPAVRQSAECVMNPECSSPPSEVSTCSCSTVLLHERDFTGNFTHRRSESWHAISTLPGIDNSSPGPSRPVLILFFLRHPYRWLPAPCCC